MPLEPRQRCHAPSSHALSISRHLLPLLSLVGYVLGAEGSKGARSFPGKTLTKRSSSSTTIYIAVLVGVFGSAVLISAGVCWDLQRRRRKYRQRAMEEARLPREERNYDHFPVRPGDEEDQVGIGPTMAMAENGAGVVLSLPNEESVNGVHTHQSDRARDGVLSSRRSSCDEREVLQEDIPQYSESEHEEITIPAPSFAPDHSRILPPGLQRCSNSNPNGSTLNDTDESRTQPPSSTRRTATEPLIRPSTPSAPPAYMPSETSQSSHAIPTLPPTASQ